jgi:diguanylate cyclase
MQNPSELARETLKTLAQRKLLPTPDNYAKIYTEISGTPALDNNGAEKVVRNMAEHLISSDKSAATGIAIKKMLDEEKWDLCFKEIEKILPSAASAGAEIQSWPICCASSTSLTKD